MRAAPRLYPIDHPGGHLNKHVAPLATALAIVGTFSLAVHEQDVKPDRAIKQDPAKFRKLQETLQAETPKLVAAAKTGDVAQLPPAVGAVGKVCNGPAACGR